MVFLRTLKSAVVIVLTSHVSSTGRFWTIAQFFLVFFSIMFTFPKKTKKTPKLLLSLLFSILFLFVISGTVRCLLLYFFFFLSFVSTYFFISRGAKCVCVCIDKMFKSRKEKPIPIYLTSILFVRLCVCVCGYFHHFLLHCLFIFVSCFIHKKRGEKI